MENEIRVQELAIETFNEPIGKSRHDPISGMSKTRTREPSLPSAGRAPEEDRPPAGSFELECEAPGRRETCVLRPGETYRFGSQESNDFVLEGDGIQPMHARLEVDERNALISRVHPEAPLIVNGTAVATQVLSPGDELTLGNSRFRLSARLDDEAVAEASDTAVSISESALPDDRDESHSSDYWQIAEDVLRNSFGGGDVSLRAGVETLATELGAKGVLLARARDIERPEGIASFGRVSGQHELRELWPDFHRAFQAKGSPSHFRTVVSDGTPVTSVTLWGSDKELFGLSIYGELEESEDSESFIRTVLCLLVTAFGARKSRLQARPRSRSTLNFPPGICVGSSDAIRRVYSRMENLADLDDPLLLVGETGVGKEHLAETLHRSSSRREKPFVAVNCAAIPDDLLEAEMFGVARGAATGVSQREGKFKEADGGTLFLDEIGEMNLALQSKLLRALESGTFHSVGGVEVDVDVRIISATNASLKCLREGETFRRDLFYRIAAHVIEVPPLRERKEDIPLLIDHFFGISLTKGYSDIRGITLAAGERLMQHSWPGNVRELAHLLRNLMLCTRGQRLIDLELVESILGREVDVPNPEREEETPDWDLATRVNELEASYITRALRATGGNQSKAADLLGIHRNTLAAKIERLGIAMPNNGFPPF